MAFGSEFGAIVMERPAATTRGAPAVLGTSAFWPCLCLLVPFRGERAKEGVNETAAPPGFFFLTSVYICRAPLLADPQPSGSR